MKLLDVTGTHQTEQSSPWKERILFWMEHIGLGRTPSQSVPRLQARRTGYGMFAIQNGGWCAASATAVKTFDEYGESEACGSDGEGGPLANQVYVIKGKLKYLPCDKEDLNIIC